MGYYTPSPEIWRGLSCPYFSHTFLVNLVVVCGLTQREKNFSLRGLIAKIQESYPANKPVAIQEGGREIPSRVAREHRADTIPNEMRHVDQSESRSCAVIERDDGRKIIIHILSSGTRGRVPKVLRTFITGRGWYKSVIVSSYRLSHVRYIQKVYDT